VSEPGPATGAAPAEPAASGLVVGEDGRARCSWGGSTPDYSAYHDEELCLEAFQSGLSWLTILRKREAFRRAFAGFDPAAVAAFDDHDVQRLLGDASIVRNRAKIEGSVRNARAVTELDRPLDELLWSFAPDPDSRPRPVTLTDVPAITRESTAMAKELKRRGFVFVGPTTCYAMMQATGMVDDHLAGCWRASP